MSFLDALLKKRKRWDTIKYAKSAKKPELRLPVPDDNIEQFKIKVGGGKFVNNFKIKQSKAL